MMSGSIYRDMNEIVLPVVHYETAPFTTLGRTSVFYGISASQKYQWEPVSHFFSVPVLKPVFGKEKVMGIYASAFPENRE